MLFMMALAQMVVILTRGIDLSVAANLALSGFVAALVSQYYPDVPLVLMILAGMATGPAARPDQRRADRLSRHPADRGDARHARRLSRHDHHPGRRRPGERLGNERRLPGIPQATLLGLTSPVWIAIAVSLAVLRLPQLHPRRAAASTRSAAIRSRRAIAASSQRKQELLAYAISGAVAGLCGYLWVARYGVAYSEIANGYELTVIAACVIGGVSIGGGIGSVAGTLLGALFLGIVMTALPVLQISPFWQMAISGAVILAAVVINARAERRPDKLILPEARRLGRDTRRSDRTRMNVVDPKIAGEPLQDRYAVRDSAPRHWRDVLLRWEVILVVLLAATIVVNTIVSPYFLDVFNLADATFNFSEKAIIALAMALLILVREIDLSVAAIVALASMAIGYAAEAGFGPGALFAVGLGVGLLCGVFNGFLVTWFSLPSIVVTIGTMSLFRGLDAGDPRRPGEDEISAGIPRPRPELFHQDEGDGHSRHRHPAGAARRSSSSWCLRSCSASCCTRRRPDDASSPSAPTRSRRAFPASRSTGCGFCLFVLSGVLAGLAAALLTARLGSMRSNIAIGWELDIVTMVILGGVSIAGGVGSILGVVPRRAGARAGDVRHVAQQHSGPGGQRLHRRAADPGDRDPAPGRQVAGAVRLRDAEI